MNERYRQIEFLRSSGVLIGCLVHDLIRCNGVITGMFVESNGFPPSKPTRHTTTFTIRFPSQDHLDSFHEMGYQTTTQEITQTGNTHE